MKFENVYWDERLLADDHLSASILAIGDSWFWYPFPGGSLLNPLGRIVATGQHVILALGNNGAEAFDYIAGVYRDRVDTALEFHGSGLSAIFISGGGNDFAGFNDLRPLLRLDCSGASTAAACYRRGDDTGTLKRLMNRTEDSLDRLINAIFAKVPPNALVYLHSYDYAVPFGKGVFGGNSAWLKPALVDAQVPQSLHQACINFLIDRFTARLKRLVKRHAGRVKLVDSRNTLVKDDWANELHPRPAGFRKIAMECWRPPLMRDGLAL